MRTHRIEPKIVPYQEFYVRLNKTYQVFNNFKSKMVNYLNLIKKFIMHVKPKISIYVVIFYIKKSTKIASISKMSLLDTTFNEYQFVLKV